MKVKIYQVRDDINDRGDLSFLGYRRSCEIIKRNEGLSDNDEFRFKDYLKSYYKMVYEYDEETNIPDEELLELIIFPKFNRGSGMKVPADFKGHSLSVSDIVEIEDKLYYCEDIGWIQI